MDKNDLETRTKALAIAVIRFVSAGKPSPAMQIVSRQLMRSATSVGANCREASRAESRRDVTHKIALAEKECAEMQYWLEICSAVNLGSQAGLKHLFAEATEVLAILVSIGRKAKSAPAGPRR